MTATTTVVGCVRGSGVAFVDVAVTVAALLLLPPAVVWFYYSCSALCRLIYRVHVLLRLLLLFLFLLRFAVLINLACCSYAVAIGIQLGLTVMFVSHILLFFLMLFTVFDKVIAGVAAL